MKINLKLKYLKNPFKDDIKKRIDETSKYIRTSEKQQTMPICLYLQTLYQDLLNRVGSLKKF